jgi:hypothetical protein
MWHPGFRTRTSLLTTLGLVAVMVVVVATGAPRELAKAAGNGITVRVSVNSSGAQGDGNSNSASMSGDSRYVAFASLASNLVSSDSNRDCPAIGEHIAVLGTWVYDTTHGWNEIHPIWAIHYSSSGRTVRSVPVVPPEFGSEPPGPSFHALDAKRAAGEHSRTAAHTGVDENSPPEETTASAPRCRPGRVSV